MLIPLRKRIGRDPAGVEAKEEEEEGRVVFLPALAPPLFPSTPSPGVDSDSLESDRVREVWAATFPLRSSKGVKTGIRRDGVVVGAALLPYAVAPPHRWLRAGEKIGEEEERPGLAAAAASAAFPIATAAAFISLYSFEGIQDRGSDHFPAATSTPAEASRARAARRQRAGPGVRS